MTREALEELLSMAPHISGWHEAEALLSRFEPPDGTGGVNPGDRRAIFHLLRGLGCKRVLEIGTHIGASTTYAAAALHRNERDADGHSFQLTTVDVVDVNDPVKQPWRRYGSTLSPLEMVTRLGARDRVRFRVGSSLAHLLTCDERYDLIFLDGDHSAAMVYREIPAALKVLNEGGFLLLHDVFPHLRPLWADGTVLPGPWLAVQRLTRETPALRLLPLGALPWPTKLGSNVSSLALLTAASPWGREASALV